MASVVDIYGLMVLPAQHPGVLFSLGRIMKLGTPQPTPRGRHVIIEASAIEHLPVA